MKQLKDLKQEILSGNIKNFYVFYGQDFGLRQHYIHKISTYYDKIVVLDNTNLLSDSGSGGRGLFTTKTLYIIYNDIAFAKQRQDQIQIFIGRLKDDGVILDYDNPLLESTLFQHFEEYTTNFPNVQDDIAEEFIDGEVKLTQISKSNLAYNCNNDYSKILLETDKIKQYSDFNKVSEQVAYDDLNNKGQLIYRIEEYNSDLLMNDILTLNKPMLSYWYIVINEKYMEEFWYSLSRILNDVLIAYLIQKFNRWDR